MRFLLTRPMRGVTNALLTTVFDIAISTHTPHARRDKGLSINSSITSFLLTRPMRGVTRSVLRLLAGLAISTHTPHARRDRYILHLTAITPQHNERTISIHQFFSTIPLKNTQFSGEPIQFIESPQLRQWLFTLNPHCILIYNLTHANNLTQ